MACLVFGRRISVCSIAAPMALDEAQPATGSHRATERTALAASFLQRNVKFWSVSATNLVLLVVLLLAFLFASGLVVGCGQQEADHRQGNNHPHL